MSGPRRLIRGFALCPLLLLLWSGHAAAADAQLVAAAAEVQGVERLAQRASAAGPSAVQALYDGARDLDEAARAAAPVTRRCRTLFAAVRTYARARVREAEGVDRLNTSIRRAGQRAAERSARRVSSARASCAGTGKIRAKRGPVMSPRPGEAFYGAVVVKAPSGVTDAQIQLNGKPGVMRPVRRGRVRFSISAPPGRYNLTVRFFRGSRRRGAVTARGVWLVPRSALTLAPATSIDRSASSRLGSALGSQPRFTAAWVQDMRTGRAGAVNAGARFPAASTVKLGLLVNSLPRLGSRPQDSPYFYDLAAMTKWSSNVAANRLLRRLGGSAAAERGLRRLGAPQSTFTGEYVVGTALQPRLPLTGIDQEPPRVSRRVTTAQDLAHMMFAFTAAATGNARARRQLGLTTQQARMALGWLLASEQRADNRSLVAGGAPSGSIIAQKNGWLRAARHSASVIFTPSGPKIAVVLTYDQRGVGLSTGQAAGAAVAQVAAVL